MCLYDLLKLQLFAPDNTDTLFPPDPIPRFLLCNKLFINPTPTQRDLITVNRKASRRGLLPPLLPPPSTTGLAKMSHLVVVRQVEGRARKVRLEL